MTKQDLDYIFNPESVAVVGVSSRGLGMQMGGSSYMESLLACKFQGRIYPVNPKGGEFQGLRIYPNIKDIPEPVDYVICSISAQQIPELLQDCAVKGVKTMQIYTGGFSDSGTEEGKQLEKKLSALARQYGIRLLGPNCVGIYHPEVGLAYYSDFPQESGSAALICQSGGNSGHIVREAAMRGVRFSKVISFGNACDINESDLLEYLTTSEDTKVIAAYIEGVKDGKRFSRVLKEAARAKPVIVLKGGMTEAGTRAAASHTGSLAGSNKVWDGLLRQVGAIKVCSLEELLDMLVTFSLLPLPLGKKAGILGWGGGISVLAADDFINAGLMIPEFPKEVQDKLESCLEKGNVGVSLGNPVDISDQAFGDPAYTCTKIMFDYEGLDLLIYHMAADIGHLPPPDKLDAGLSLMATSTIKAYRESGKPLAVVIPFSSLPYIQECTTKVKQIYSEAGIPIYHSLGSAAKAIARFINYYERRPAKKQAQIRVPSLSF